MQSTDTFALSLTVDPCATRSVQTVAATAQLDITDSRPQPGVRQETNQLCESFSIMGGSSSEENTQAETEAFPDFHGEADVFEDQHPDDSTSSSLRDNPQSTSDYQAQTKDVARYNYVAGLAPLYSAEESQTFQPDFTQLTETDVRMAEQSCTTSSAPIIIHETEAKIISEQLLDQAEANSNSFWQPFCTANLDPSPLQDELEDYFIKTHAHSPGPLRHVSPEQVQAELLTILKPCLFMYIVENFARHIPSDCRARMTADKDWFEIMNEIFPELAARCPFVNKMWNIWAELVHRIVLVLAWKHQERTRTAQLE